MTIQTPKNPSPPATGRYGYGRKRAVRGTVGLSSAAYNGHGTLSIPVQRTAGWDGNVLVEWVLTPGTAQAGVDYLDDSGSLFFASRVRDDETIEVRILPGATPGRTLTVALTVAAADEGITEAVVTIS